MEHRDGAKLMKAMTIFRKIRTLRLG
jgi:hypothetical protein